MSATPAPPILVQKYGGSSVASTDHIKNVARRVVQAKRQGNSLVVVVSAMGKTTDELLGRARKITLRPPHREMDMLLHAGEIVSASLLAMAIQEEGEGAVSMTGSQAGMITDAAHTQARIQGIRGEKILGELEAGRVVVITGFQGMTADREITTLGRGGSDTSAVAFAVGIGAASCEILTDVDGVFTADPRVVPGAKKMDWCSYDEMLEMASLGSRVLHARSVEIARRFDVPLIVSSSFKEMPGTCICSSEHGQAEYGKMEEVSIRGVAHNGDVSKVSIVGVPDQPGVAAKVFAAVSQQGTNILLIVQAEHHGGTNDISFLVSSDVLPHLKKPIDDLVAELGGARVVIDEDVGTISIVGDGVQSGPGVAARMFTSLAEKGINIDLISTSNLMVTCVVPRDRLEEAVKTVHAEFFE